MDILFAERIAYGLAKRYGVNDIYVKFNNSRRYFGRACHGGVRVLELSKPMVELNNIKQVKETILHELAHLAVGPNNGHNEIWRQKVISFGGLGCTYWTDAERANKLGAVVAAYKGTVKCRQCNYQRKAFRKPRYFNNRLCPKCKSNLKWEVI